MTDTPDGVADDGVADDVAELGYAEALAELETILDELERDDLDVDVLTVRVQRAAALIAHCRSRIETARVTVETVVAGLGGTGDGEGTDDETLPLDDGN